MLLWFLAVAVIFMNIPPYVVSQQTILSIVPPEIDVTLNDSFTLNLSITDVTDLYSWI